MANVFERAVTKNSFDVFPAHVAEAAAEIIAELDHIAGENRRNSIFCLRFSFDKSAEPLARVTGEVGFSDFAVINNVETAVELFLHDVGNRASHPRGEGNFIDLLASALCRMHLLQIVRLGQRAGVSCENSLCAALHLIHSSIMTSDKPAGLKICALKRSVKQQNKPMQAENVGKLTFALRVSGTTNKYLNHICRSTSPTLHTVWR